MTSVKVEKPALRPELPTLPERIKRLPVDPARGYPVPWFVEWVDGKPDFRIMSHEKLLKIVGGEKRCWTCGQPLGRYLAFVIGPMCAVNRISAEPPSHFECAVFSAKACPFLSRPRAHRREAGKPEGLMDAAGTMIARNPGVALVWVTRSYRVIDTRAQHTSRYLFQVGDPAHVFAFAQGRQATKEEVAQSIDSGLPLLEQACELENTPERQAGARQDLARQVILARQLLGVPKGEP